ncbi:MAG TPA: S4 domain-containing protein [Alphaproteobacteria bacterium]|jgi:ribosome-associated heat shock protein Hsp15
MADGTPTERLDKWLWCARFFKTRALASTFCETAGVRIAGQPVRKAHYQVRLGDVLTFVQSHGPARDHVRVLRIAALSERRLSPVLASALYDDLSPPEDKPPPTPEELPVAPRERGSGRPTKADRRAITRLKDDE